MNNELKNFHGISFKGDNHADVDFSGADLRGCDFTGAILTNANLSGCKTGLKTSSAVIVFCASLIISLLSGYFAMLTGETVQTMYNSADNNQHIAAYVLVGLMIVFILLFIWKGGINTIITIASTIVVALLIGLIAFMSGLGTGIGSLYGSLALILFVVMMFVGTIARAAAGTLSSSIIFLIVAIGGGLFGKSLGGGIGTVVLAVACAIISKRVLSGKGSFPLIKNIALKTGTYFGTSFKDADLTGVNFSDATIKNTNFKGAKLTGVIWDKAIRKFNLED